MFSRNSWSGQRYVEARLVASWLVWPLITWFATKFFYLLLLFLWQIKEPCLFSHSSHPQFPWTQECSRVKARIRVIIEHWFEYKIYGYLKGKPSRVHVINPSGFKRDELYLIASDVTKTHGSLWRVRAELPNPLLTLFKVQNSSCI